MPGGERSTWSTALKDLRRADSILLLGATDTGKTTLLTQLATTLQAQGRRMAIVDADVGQSSVGPPTTIGLAIVDAPFHGLQEMSSVALHFVGSTTPRGHLVSMVVGTGRMTDRARALGADGVIVDTCGFVGGEGGRRLKRAQIAIVKPEVVVCLQRGDECERILDAYCYREQPRIVRLRPAFACRRRSIVERRFYREQAIHRYFAGSRLVTLRWDDLDLVETPLWRRAAFDVAHAVGRQRLELPDILWAECHEAELHVVTESPVPPSAVTVLERITGKRLRAWLAAEFRGTLLGLLDRAGETLGIGLLRRIDYARHALEVLVPVYVEDIAGIHWSQTLMEPFGRG
jgi:polynucleotide 5'-hydroxyl-kinase GRC3/NOL9